MATKKSSSGRALDVIANIHRQPASGKAKPAELNAASQTFGEVSGAAARERERLYCLAEAIRQQLVPSPGGDSPQPLALGLSEVLCDLLQEPGDAERAAARFAAVPDRMGSAA